MDDGGLSQARAAYAARIRATAEREAKDAERADAIASRLRVANRRRIEEQTPRVNRAIEAFLSAARREQLAPERFYLGDPSEPWHLGFKVFHWEKYVGDGQSAQVSVVVSLDGLVSFGNHHGSRPLFGSDSEVLPFHFSGDQEGLPLSTGWGSAPHSGDAANVVVTTAWFVLRLAKYLEDHSSGGRLARP